MRRLLEELFSNSYLYCLPSNIEGMPISLLEALSFGNCCVCSDISECTEVIGEDGFSFPVGNSEKLRELLQKLCDHEELVEDLETLQDIFWKPDFYFMVMTITAIAIK